MTSEGNFQAMLDANPDDHATRLILADFLQDRGDPRAEGYRALGALRLAPWKGADGRWVFGGQHLELQEQRPVSEQLPKDWMDRLLGPAAQFVIESLRVRRTRSRDAIENEAAWAFSGLPAERRAELLRVPQEATR
jgi:uncharacterized protein (TIGR02996 family)